ncbi:MAG: CotH kinase family protein [Lachnospiraceae bacterium]|nr:CotH kinase family protein [Lachnospiraceae bacterium]
MTGKRHKIFIYIIIIVSIVFLIGMVVAEKKSVSALGRITLDLSDSEMDELRGIRFYLPADENAGLMADIFSTVFEEDELMQYLILPGNIRRQDVTCYAMDPFGHLLQRYVIDFSGTDTFDIGIHKLEAVYTDLPVLSFTAEPLSMSFEELLNSDKTAEWHGFMTVSVDRKTARERNWPEVLISKAEYKYSKGSVILRGRGNTSWEIADKKSFTLELSSPEYLFDLGKRKQFNLISGYTDRSLLNNEVFMGMAGKIGIPYEPGCERVTLYVDGEYQGVYLVTGKVRVRKDEVNLKDGDFFINWGDPQADQALYYDTEIWADDMHYFKPYANIIWPKNETEEELFEKKEIVQRFVSAIEDQGSDDYLKYMDLDSMVRFYWIQEISMNYDADYRSIYSYYRADTGRIYMGPVWDMDQSLGWNAGKAGWDYRNPEGFVIRDLSWYPYLFSRQEFKDAVKDAYFNGGVREAMFEALDEYERKSRDMVKDGSLDYRKWRSSWPDLEIKYGNSYAEQTEGSLSFFRRRVQWIDESMKAE